MLESGSSVLAGMKRNGIATDLPDAVLVSHFHGDHFGGIPYLYLEYTFVNNRDRPLTVAGPPGIEQRVCGLYSSLYGAIQCRDLPFELHYVEIEPGQSVELAGFRCEAFQVPHNAEPFSLGYRIESGQSSLLFSGDSAWTDEFVERSRGTGLFLCECCSMDPLIPLHSSYREILSRRSQLGCKRLLLTHLGEDVRAASGLEIERAYDGMVIEI